MDACVSILTYRRGQIEWALWQSFRPLGSRDDGPPPIFKTRIKRLLDLDRDLDVTQLASRSPSDFAFVTSFKGGSGVEAAYAPADVPAIVGADLVELAPLPGLHVFDYTAAHLAYKMLSYALSGTGPKTGSPRRR